MPFFFLNEYILVCFSELTGISNDISEKCTMVNLSYSKVLEAAQICRFF